ncbi:prepilin-type N-terminal cleavage/methylation domain-containing protein [Tepidibacillus fermentans]|nr:prepilin-type N-terminal cleavage/methylation domain-containing protein [Tepidibacillus fermentans]
MDIRKHKGFIQLEVVFVLFMIGMLLSFSIPSFRNFQERSELEQWVDQFLADYFWAQQEAVHTDKWVEIVFNSDAHFYLIRNERGLIKKVQYSNNIFISENFLNHRIMFNAFGQLAYRNGTIDVVSPSGERQLVIQLETGQIHVKK